MQRLCFFQCFVCTLLIIRIIHGVNGSECGQVYTQQQFILESPLYPSNYPLSYQCSYVVKAPCAAYVTLEFLDFQLEESLGCAKDRLEVGDRDALCGLRTGSKTYFAEKGTLLLKFLSDTTISGRGYRILVTQQSSCQQQPIPTSTQRDIEIPTTPKPVLQNTSSRCCQPFYRAKQFTLTSPNFPNSMGLPSECTYEIRKLNPNVCRLRIQARFFWLGPENDCFGGYLQIDDRYICGCKSDFKTVVTFQGDQPKLIKFSSRGLVRNSYSGFVLDVIQDECPKRYIPIGQFKSKEESREEYTAWPEDATVEKLQLVTENINVEDNVVKHIYVYEPSPGKSYYDYDRKNMSGLDYETCLLWNRQQFSGLENALNGLNCRVNEGSTQDGECVQLTYPKGYFKSPGYPFYYPANSNVCYRFIQPADSCGVRVHISDFDLEPSQDCVKDYLQIENSMEKYCGFSLTNTLTEIDFTDGKSHQDMRFVSDGNGCARGFYGTYEQIPCNYDKFNITRPCLQTIQDREFLIEINDSDGPCTIVIKPHSRDICRVRIYFEHFDLVCAYESLVFNNMMYCGRLTGQSAVIDSRRKEFAIIYNKKSGSDGYYRRGVRLRLKGIQENCFDNEVPLERVFVPSKKISDINSTRDLTYLVKLRSQFKEICGIVTNTTEVKLPETFCELLGKQNVSECIPLKNNSISILHPNAAPILNASNTKLSSVVPLESRKIELDVSNVENTTRIEFTLVDCNNSELKPVV